MVNQMVAGMVARLRTRYPEEAYPIDTEGVGEAPAAPCFLLSPMETRQAQVRGGRYRLQQDFCLEYRAAAGSGNQERLQVGAALFELLAYIRVGGDLLRGTAMRYETKDGIARFYVTYGLFYIKTQPLEAMEQCQVQTGLEA